MNLLTDPILSAEPAGVLTLPGLLAACARGEVRAFPRLRAHQRAAWHMFRTQLAALALDRAGLGAPPENEATWRDLLLALTDGNPGPWALVETKRSEPAFLQAPDPGGLKWEPVPTPDALDLLITARNHDLKAAVADDAAPEDWVLALVSLQTSEGYGGRGPKNSDGSQGIYGGIARMNRGASSRAMLGLAPAGPGGQPDPSSWWRRDLGVLLRSRDEPTGLTRGGLALLWCLPWPEGRQIDATGMDPWAIEVCRRVRLRLEDGAIRAERAGSVRARVEADGFHGVLDDPWAPVNRREAKALTLGEGRFDYRRMVTLLASGDWTPPLAARLDAAEGEEAGGMVVVAEALSRGNSKTDGLQSRIVPVPQAALGLFRTGSARIAAAAEAQMVEIRAADGALRDAVALYAAGGERTKIGKAHRLRAGSARARLDAFADRVFFDHLWARVAAMEAGPDAEAAAIRAFREGLAATARAELTRAFGALPCPTIRAPRARVRARGALEGLLRHHRLVEETTHA